MTLTISDKDIINATLDEIMIEIENPTSLNLSKDIKLHIETFSSHIDVATTAFTNIVTCLVAKIVDQDIDPRFHRKPGKDEEGMPPPPSGKDNWFSGRSISEKIIYKWLSFNGYRTAKSGWQTRTFERPRPYTLDYPENIDYVKENFLFILDKVANNKVSAKDVLLYFLQLEETEKEKRETSVTAVAKFQSNEDKLIHDIITIFEKHFKIKDSARLPVLAIYATYQTVMKDIKKYEGLNLENLGSHEAADFRTGSLGDIEIYDQDGHVAEAIEIKHDIPIDEIIALRAKEKILKSSVSRYYILTTHHSSHIVDEKVKEIIEDIFRNHGCQLIVNGIIPTMTYYLRLASKPEQVLKFYSDSLIKDRRIKTHHIEEWSTLIND